MAKASFTLLAAAMAIVALVTPAVAIEEQCSACQAINKELATKIVKDSPWKKSKPRPKTTPLKMTEYEIITSMESVCNKMKGYNLKEDETTKEKTWQRVSEEGKMPVSFSFGGENPDLGSLNFEKEIGSQRGVREYDDKQIFSYCTRILEEREEMITEALQGGEVTAANAEETFSKLLCQWGNKKTPCSENEILALKDEL